ncbi:MAG TPA: hypothetical protein VJA00_00935 [Candidatus Omnitrophota bacterium]|nr:hypothetical protein [Candidatus Omnitrophota bacterium]
MGYVRIHGIGGLKEEMVKAVAEEMVASLMSDAVLAKELFPYLVNQNGVVRLELSENELAQFDTVEKRSQLFRVLAKTALGLSILNPDLAIEVAGPEKYKQEFIRTIGVVQKEEFEKAGKKIRPWAIQYDPDPTNLPNVLISEKIDPKVKSFNPKSDANDQVIELSEKSIGASLLTGVLLLSKVPDEGVKKMEGREEYRWKNEYSIGIFAALGAFINAAAIKAIERAA